MFSVNFSITAMQSTSKNNVSIASNTIPTCIKTVFGWLCIVHFYIDIYMKQYTVPLLRAFCASWVMASASSNITSLKPDLQRSKDMPYHLSPQHNLNNDTKCSPQCNWESQPGTYLKIVLVLAKLRTAPRTMPIPRSSDAFSCNKMYRTLYRIPVYMYCTRMYMWLAHQILKEK